MKRILSTKQKAGVKAAGERYRARKKAALLGQQGPPLIARKGVPYRPVSVTQRKTLQVLPAEDRALVLKRIRQREWIAKKRKQDPEKYLQAVRDWRKKAIAAGYYRAGGKGAGRTRTNKQLAYFRWYNLHVRKPRSYYATLSN